MDVSVEDQGERRVARVREPRIDAASSIQFKDAMRAAAEGASGPVVLDLGEVDFIDSSGLGAIVSTMKMLAPAKRLELANLRPNVAKVFALTRMDRVFVIHDALAAEPGHAA